MKSIIIFTTVGNEKDAKELTKKLIEDRLAVCVQIDKIKSIYRWKGKVETEDEFRLGIKTNKKLYKKIEKFIINNHKYDLPEIFSIKIDRINKKYLNWMYDGFREKNVF